MFHILPKLSPFLPGPHWVLSRTCITTAPCQLTPTSKNQICSPPLLRRDWSEPSRGATNIGLPQGSLWLVRVEASVRVLQRIPERRRLGIVRETPGMGVAPTYRATSCTPKGKTFFTRTVMRSQTVRHALFSGRLKSKKGDDLIFLEDVTRPEDSKAEKEAI